MKTIHTLTLLTTAAIAVSLNTATAAAAPTDPDFVNELDTKGITIDMPATLVGNTARLACTQAEMGYSAQLIGWVIEDQLSLTESQSQTFLNTAIAHYCPNV